MKIEPQKILYDMSGWQTDNFSSDLSKLMKAHGWNSTKTPRSQFNEWNCWGFTVQRMVLQFLDHKPICPPANPSA